MEALIHQSIAVGKLLEAVVSHLHVKTFKEMERRPFCVAFVFCILYFVFCKLGPGVCDTYAPYEEVKVRSLPTPWINSRSTITLQPMSGYCSNLRLVRLLTRC